MTRKKIVWTLSLGVLLIAVVGLIVILVAHRFYVFSVEDRIHNTFFPVADALYRYEEETGHPASSLNAVIPKYISAIPSSSLADPPTYRVLPSGKVWELVIHSNALSRPRLYICRSTQEFTPEEIHRMILQYHATWTVFPADT